jgi:small subunit ribosomal protein S16
MAVRIRLRRTGKRNAPAHRIVVADARSPRDGRFIEIIGTYDPRNKIEKIDMERAEYWVSQGAQVSETVGAIMHRAKNDISLYDRKLERDAEEAKKRAEEEAKRKAEAEAEAKKKAEEEAAAAAAAEAETKTEEAENTEEEAETAEEEPVEEKSE